METKSGTLNHLKIPSINTIKGKTSIHDPNIVEKPHYLKLENKKHYFKEL